jgi:hypothetical protein
MELPEGLAERIKDKDIFLDTRGVSLTKGLFWEFEYGQRKRGVNYYKPIYNLREYDHHETYSLKKLYLELMDPTEYQVASQLFYSWKHWQKLCETEWFKEHVEAWRSELEIKLTSEAYHTIAQQAAVGGKDAVPAAKYLAERGWEKKKKGRPSKEEVAGERKKQAGLRKVVDNDAERIGIKSEPTRRD